MLLNAIGLQGLDVMMAVTSPLTACAIRGGSILLATDCAPHRRSAGLSRAEESIATWIPSVGEKTLRHDMPESRCGKRSTIARVQ